MPDAKRALALLPLMRTRLQPFSPVPFIGDAVNEIGPGLPRLAAVLMVALVSVLKS